MKKATYGGGFFTIGCFLIAVILYPYLPVQIPIHWGSSGIDKYGGPEYIFLFPSILLILNISMIALQRLDPKKDNYRKFQSTYAAMIWLMNLMMTFLFFCTIYAVFYPQQVNMNAFVQLLIGIIICVFGNLMPRVRQNYFVGIKTPWVLADEKVWMKTHRFSGKLWFFAGLIWIFTAFLPIPVLAFHIGMLILIVIIPIAYSYIIYQKQHKKENKND